MFHKIFSLLPFAVVCLTSEAQSDYTNEAPKTVYEADQLSPQNMDYDAVNKMFTSHSGWYNDKLVHYYKFRMYTPMTYAGIIKLGSSSMDVPIQKIFFLTSDGSFDGVIGKPIIEFHTHDGNSYSDFMQVHFVIAPDGYIADSFKSEGDINESGANVVPTETILNIPVVPTGSTLQDTKMQGTNKAPIMHVPVFYKGHEVWTYVFEVTSQKAADFFAYTRVETSTSITRASAVGDYAIPVVQNYATKDFVTSIPIWHVNQFSRGVIKGKNGGGPSPAGMRNIINLDRPDAGYSPLWQVFWGTKLPINYSADKISNSMDATAENGFEFKPTPMFVNCPDIGAVGTEINPIKEAEFVTMIHHKTDETYWIMGSDMSLIMQAEVDVIFKADGVDIGSTKTNMMGAYEFELEGSDIPEGTLQIDVITGDTVIRTIMVVEGGSGASFNGIVVASSLVAFLLTIFV